MTDPFRRAQITMPDRERTTIPAEELVPHPACERFDVLSPERQRFALEILHLLSQMGPDDARMLLAHARRLAK